MKVEKAARKFRVWTAHSTDRDFRDDKWTSKELESKDGGLAASVDVPKPESGFTAVIVEAEMEATTGQIYKLSTQAQVVPDNVNKN